MPTFSECRECYLTDAGACSDHDQEHSQTQGLTPSVSRWNRTAKSRGTFEDRLSPCFVKRGLFNSESSESDIDLNLDRVLTNEQEWDCELSAD